MDSSDGAAASQSSVAQSLRKAWGLLSRRERRELLVLWVAVVVQAALELVGVGAVPAFVGAVSGAHEAFGQAPITAWLAEIGIRDESDVMVGFGALLILAFAIKTAYAVFAAWLQARFLQKLRVRIGSTLFATYMQAPYSFHLKRNPADLMRNASQEVDRMIEFVLAPVLAMLAHGFIAVCTVGLMLVVNPWVTVLGIGSFGLASYGYLMLIRKRSLAFGRTAQVHRGKLIKAVNEGLGGLKEARVLGRQQLFIDAFRHSNELLASATEHRMVTTKSVPPGLELIGALGLTAVVGMLMITGWAPREIIPMLALFAAALLRLRQAVTQIVHTVNVLRYDHVTVGPIHDDLTELAASQAPPAAAESLKFENAIELDHVTFRYPGTERLVLEDITLRIPRGACVAFVGETGAGKSTLADLLLGLLRPDSGRILVDGQDIQQSVRAWQSNIGYIPQALYIVDDTVRQNIAFGLPPEAVDEGRIIAAAKAAQLQGVLETLPEGLDTMLGDRGIRLSGGQRQRVCIARALYHNPQVLILDEATSALDNSTEQRIVEELEARRGDRTLIIIAHRLSTVRNCDRLYLLRQGQIEAAGTYEELSRNNQDFRRLTAAKA